MVWWALLDGWNEITKQNFGKSFHKEYENINVNFLLTCINEGTKKKEPK